MTDEVKPLSDDEVEKVAKRVRGNEPLRLYLAEFGIDVDALCATVRALRLDRDSLTESYQELEEEHGKRVTENTVLREQLAEARKHEQILQEQVTRLAELAETRSDIIAAKGRTRRSTSIPVGPAGRERQVAR